MFKFEDTEESINKIAEIIIQDPGFFLKLKKDLDFLREKKILENNREFCRSQKKILRKAERIANKSLWYGFYVKNNLQNREGYIIYKRLENRLIPVNEDFKNANLENYPLMNSYSFEEYIKKEKIKNLITFKPDPEKVYSHKFDEDNLGEINLRTFKKKGIEYKLEHNPIFLLTRIEKSLKNHKGTLTKLNLEQELQINKELKPLT